MRSRWIGLAETDFFWHTLTVPAAARLEYKFIVDGEWKPDPLCPNRIDNGIGEQNSFFVVGEFHEPPELEWRDNIAHGRVEEFDFTSTRLRNTRRVYVYLPAAYDRDGEERFPSFMSTMAASTWIARACPRCSTI